MKILTDSQIFDTQKFGGISRYYNEIFSRIIEENQIIVPILITNNEYLKESNLLIKKNNLEILFLKFLSKIGISIRKKVKMANRKNTVNALKNQNFDVFIPTYYDPFFLEHIKAKPFVLTVYDMTHELFPDYFVDIEMVVKGKKILLEKATKIIAVSNNTKKDILKIYPHIDSSKIKVIYHGNSIKIIENIKVNLPENYILFVGVRDNYKNFKFFIISISELLRNDSTLNVIAAGGGEFTKDEIEFISNLGLENQIKQRFFKEKELGLYYKNAKCFVFPSEYEGFGIPVLEAMACGCPIVLTDNSSFPEVAGDAGIFFELNNEYDLKHKINNLLQNDNLRNEYSLKGLEQVKKFNWDDAAKQCHDIYKLALN
jgi:glycosyltransferase involved in cell wall biosynthesis